jgi:hypothetical protein
MKFGSRPRVGIVWRPLIFPEALKEAIVKEYRTYYPVSFKALFPGRHVFPFLGHMLSSFAKPEAIVGFVSLSKA